MSTGVNGVGCSRATLSAPVGAKAVLGAARATYSSNSVRVE